jgi:tetratricopeptide (TPR) repeat protein
VCRLIRCNSGARFGGVVHETIIQQTNIRVPEDIFFEHLPEKIGLEKTLARFVRDRELLYKEYQANPYHARTLFYLARTCEDLGHLEEAYHLYKKRIKLVGWDEEDFMTYYRLAETIKKLVLQNYPERYRWNEAFEYYIKAYQMRSHRAEPLIGIAEYYVLIDQMDLAYVFARRAVEIAYPVSDMLFIEKYLYTYYRHELLARCAWYVKEFEVGSLAADMAYTAYPDYEYAQINKSCYDSYKKEVGLR